MLRALSCLLLAASFAAAQGGKKKPDFDIPEEELPRPEQEATEREHELAPTLRRLAGWPGDRSRAAAERLIVFKEKSLPLIKEILLSQSSKVVSLKPGAAYVLGRVGERSDFLTLLLIAAEKKQQKHAETFLEAAWRLNEEDTVAEAFRFFHLSETTLRHQAVKFVRHRVKKKNLPAVLELLDTREAERPFTREIGLVLLDKLVETNEVTWKEAGPRFYRSLGDESPQVASRAMRLLASRNDAESIAALNALITKEVSFWRQRSYAALALGLLASAYRVQPFAPETLDVLRGEKGLLHRKEMLAQASAGLALGHVALRTGDKELVRLLDRQIPVILIEAVGAGNRHYRDFNSVMPLAYSMLRRITGQNLPDHAPEWARWWRDNGRRFRAKRELLGVEENDLPDVVLEIKAPADAGGEAMRFAVVEKSRPTYLHGRAYAVPATEMEDVARVLTEAGFFEQPEVDPGKVAAGAAVVTMSVGDLVRRVQFAPGDDGTAARDRVVAYFDSLAREYTWQLWWDIDTQADWEVFFGVHNKWFQANRDPELRAERLRSMVASSLDEIIHVEDRLYAARFVAALPGGGRSLDENQIDAFVRTVQTERKANAYVGAVVELLVPDAGPKAATSLIDALADKVGPNAQSILVGLCESLPAARVAKLASDPRWKVRRAALGALVGADPNIGRPVFIERLADKEKLVRVVAAEALARIKDPAILPALTALEKDKEAEVRRSAAYAYGLLGGRKGIEGIRPLLFEEVIPDVKIRGIEGLVEGKDPGAPDLLVEVLEREQKWRHVRAAAASGLVELETPQLVERLVVRLELTPAHSPARVALVNVLARFQSDRPLDILRAVLQGDDEVSADAAALGLARRWDSSAVGQLIKMVEKKRNPRTAVRHLQILTSQAFDAEKYEVQAENYKAWYKNASVGHPRLWFRDALTLRGYETLALASYADAEETARPALPDEAVELCLKALRDKDWFIRRNASNVLADRIGSGAPPVLEHLLREEEAEAAIRAYHDWWRGVLAKKEAEERG